MPANNSTAVFPPLQRRASRWVICGVWLTIVGGFMAYRSSDFYVWNDSPAVMVRAGAGSWAEAQECTESLRQACWSDPGEYLLDNLQSAFSRTMSGGYRPVSALQTNLARLLMEGTGTVWWHLFAWGAAYATFAICLYFVAGRFVRYQATAALAVALLLFSPPCVASSWVIVAGFQILVPLWICASLLLYWQTVEGCRGRRLCAAMLCGMMLLGPWIREFLGIIPVLVGCLELLRAGRPTRWLGLAAVFLAHAVFPTAIIRVLFYPQLPLETVFRMGSLGAQMSSSVLRWQAGWNFIPLFPPTLLAAVGLMALAPNDIRQGAAARVVSRWSAFVRNARRASPWLWLAAVCLSTLWFREYLPVALCLGLAVVGWQRDPFICIWFLLSFLPILRVFTEHVHFLYALVPASIIVGGSLERLWIVLTEALPRVGRIPGFAAQGARWAVPVFAVFCAADQALNLYGSWSVVHAQYAGMKVVADSLRKRVPVGAAVVGNVIHLDEIKWFANSHFQSYFTVRDGIADPRRAVEPQQLRALLAERSAHPVYFLDCNFDYLPHKVHYHRHKYVHHSIVSKTDLGVVRETHVRYPFLDPLRHFVSAEFVPFLGPPDLVDDFSRGRGPRPRPFFLETSATYRLYRVEGGDVETISKESIHLVEYRTE